MHEYTASIQWTRSGTPFTANRYSRRHHWTFDGGASIPAAASPQVVPPTLTDATCVDPEEAFVAALSSCHMLWFLSIAAERGITVERYDDAPVGRMNPDAEVVWMSRVTLRPAVAYAAPVPSTAVQEVMHEAAHAQCFLANSVRTDIVISPRDGSEADVG